MFIGFGYLMTFLKEYGMGAVGYTMMITVVGIQWALFTELFFKQLYDGEVKPYRFDIISFVEALYAVAAILISFGGVIGKLNPFQILLMTILELVFYSFNNQIFLVGSLKLADIGGTIIIHMFGAYFGLAVAYHMGNKDKVAPVGGYVADVFAFIGTLFLWIYWPSFVAGALDAGGHQQQRAIYATLISLASSTTVAFALSSWFSKDASFRPVDIQNATLAGGVAIGAIANLTLSPLLVCLVGMIAGAISTLGFAKIQPYLEEKIGLYDTCGIHNLHGMPSVIGGIFSIIVAGYKQSNGRHSDEAVFVDHSHNQWLYQFYAIIITLIFALITGTFTGYFIRNVGRNHKMPYFQDKDTWHNSDA